MKALITLMLILLIGALALAKETSNGFEMENVEMGHILDSCPYGFVCIDQNQTANQTTFSTGISFGISEIAKPKY